MDINHTHCLVHNHCDFGGKPFTYYSQTNNRVISSEKRANKASVYYAPIFLRCLVRIEDTNKISVTKCLVVCVKQFVNSKALLPTSTCHYIIYSDKLKAYNNITTLGYKHFTINHSVEFVMGNIHTQNVERMWRSWWSWYCVLVLDVPSRNKTFLATFSSPHDADTHACFNRFMHAAAKLYPPGGNKESTVASSGYSEEE